MKPTALALLLALGLFSCGGSQPSEPSAPVAPPEPAGAPTPVASAPVAQPKATPKKKAKPAALPKELAGYELAWDVPRPDKWITHAIAIAPDGNVAVAGDERYQYVRLLSGSDGSELGKVKVEASDGLRDGPSLFFVSENRVVLMNRWFGELVDFDAGSVKKVAEKGEKAPDYLVAAFAQGKLALVSKDEVRVFDTKTWKLTHTIALDLPSRPTFAAYSPDGETLALRHQVLGKAGGERPPTVRLFSRKGSQALGAFTAEDSPLAFSPDGRRLFGRTIGKTGAVDGELTLTNNLFCGAKFVPGPMNWAGYVSDDMVVTNAALYPADASPKKWSGVRFLTVAADQGLMCVATVERVACYKRVGGAQTAAPAKASALLAGTLEKRDGKLLELALARTPWIRSGTSGRLSAEIEHEGAKTNTELATVKVKAVGCGHATVEIVKQLVKGDLKDIVKDGAAVRVAIK
jgi:hypothetical protein